MAAVCVAQVYGNLVVGEQDILQRPMVMQEGHAHFDQDVISAVFGTRATSILE
jgi:hypothetical protein